MKPLAQCDFIDLHYHAAPDLYKRRHSVFEAGKQYQDLNGAVVLKSHLGSTAVQATLAQQQGFPVFPSIVLNHIAGGIHYRPILQALAEYHPIIPSKLIVHLPTITGRQHQSKLSRESSQPLWHEKLNQPETIFNSQGKLSSELIDILKLANNYPIVLSTGHASKDETLALVEACEKYNVSHLLLNQPANPMTGFCAVDLFDLVKTSCVWVEQTALTYLLMYQDELDFKAVLQSIPKVIYSSDLGQTSQIDIKDWHQLSLAWFSKFNISTNRRAEICLSNPLQLLKI
jgi:hypothetical protein